MAKNDFSSEVAQNYDQKCLCVLVLDVSGSMNMQVGNSTPIQELNEGLKSFHKDILDDEKLSEQLEVSVITFNHIVRRLVDPTLLDESFEMPKLNAMGSTAMVSAVNDAIGLVDDRKNWYKDTGQPYTRPWIILITDGEPDDGQDVDGLAKRIKEDMNNKKYAFLPIGVEGASMKTLTSITGEVNGKPMGPIKLKGTRFSDFFQWLSASMSTVVESKEGETVSFGGADIDTSWMDSFTI